MAIVTIERHYLSTKPGATKMTCSVNIGGKLVIHGCRWVQGQKGFFASMPQQKNPSTDKYVERVTILDESLKQQVVEAIGEHYEKVKTPEPDVPLGGPQEEAPF